MHTRTHRQTEREREMEIWRDGDMERWRDSLANTPPPPPPPHSSLASLRLSPHADDAQTERVSLANHLRGESVRPRPIFRVCVFDWLVDWLRPSSSVRIGG
eukprot:GHVU01055751.1.p1 GENE.GHVU01055751.1~~GHVU01055751.1.p1  ORF type:complete len:101 (+),score=18.88 GHVU01055751.1:2-304(+)